MESTEEVQKNELTALQSIYAEDFQLIPPSKAWKVSGLGAASLPEISIRVRHPERANIGFGLNVKFPKTYPTLTYPNFTVQKPRGLDHDQIIKLTHALQNEVRASPRTEMVFQIVTFCQEWLSDNVAAPAEVIGSLAVQMRQRAAEEERARQEEAEREAKEREQRLDRLAREFDADVQKQQQLAREQHRTRQRANSETTEVPYSDDTPTETFDEDIEMNGVHFDTVKFFHPRKSCLGTIYSADPVCDDTNTTLPLELHVITFDSHYYTTNQGRKKVKQVEEEIIRLKSVRHPNVVRVLAVKLNAPHSSGAPQLVILSEQSPALSLKDVLSDCDCLREDRVSDYIVQILAGLNAIHVCDLVHRGINAASIGLATQSCPSQSKLIKLSEVGYHTRLLDLHRSNAFACVNPPEERIMPEAWLSKDAKNESLLLYTRQRDIHAVGVVLLQMLLGLDVTERFADVHTALRSSAIPPAFQSHAMNMLVPPKKSHINCLTLLADLAESSLHRTRRSLSISMPEPKTPLHASVSGSPEFDYFRGPTYRQASRWKEDWEELELLGRGAFGSVVKARNRIDNRVYAVKKVRLRTLQSDTKIFREVNALSRLSHRFIVRYYTTWVETAEPTSTGASDESESESDSYSQSNGTENGMTSVPSRIQSREPSGPIIFNMDDLDDLGGTSKGSFPSIHFTRSSESQEDTDSDNDTPFGGLFRKAGDEDGEGLGTLTPTLTVQRTLYIQMEFVERQTLKERVDEGISESEAWRLFQQIVDALVHMSTLGIIHRDIKLTNIFIDAKGDCKVGDFGLATSSLAAVDPSDVSPRIAAQETDMTLEVGTRLYIAPEVQSRRRRPTNHTKADMYSLGVVFFEMNYFFTTGSERISVIEALRRPEIIFPDSWDSLRLPQREIITWLLQHEPDDRPTALELSQSPLLPSRLEDEYFKGALKMMTKPDSPHHQAVLASLFQQPPRPVRSFLYDHEAELPEHASLNGMVQDHLTAIFRLRGAVDMEPPLLMPITSPEDDKDHAVFIDRHGDIVKLPSSLLVTFARLAARGGITRIKRFHIADVYRPQAVAGHPRPHKAAVFDIITPDLMSGPVAAGAEILAVANNCLDTFPNLAQMYEIHVSHSNIVDAVLGRLPAEHKSTIVEILNQPKSSTFQKRALFLKKGLLRSIADELEVLSDTYEDVEPLLMRLDKLSSPLLDMIRPAIEETKRVVKTASLAGVSRPVKFYPLMVGNHLKDFKHGILVEVVRRSRRIELLAAGGRYDNLITKFSPPKPTAESIYAVGLQIAIDKITAAVASFQSSSAKSLLKEAKSFGYWSPRRCDVYVISYHPGYLQDRLGLASYLWRHNISADIMYESAITNVETSVTDTCKREGILFTVNPRPKRDQTTGVKVTAIFGNYSDEDTLIPRQELVAHLQEVIAAQKRADLATSGATTFFEGKNLLANKETTTLDLQTVLPAETVKKGLRRNKLIVQDKAHELGTKIHRAFTSNMPMLVVDIPPAMLVTLTRTNTWITSDEAWKLISPGFNSHVYAQQVRDAVAKRKEDGFPFILLYAAREERALLLQLR
ncbi:Serine/threonine-protein kinase [Guyanagaster necrorhizus]|uniref:non-specific serine/threonine protein kinase n=1 Tax=Guyanagaster necrorhizus TaxID=856835 RepID=A0A9P7VG36_9AGAR|nr:Serine/threonine-protein kinase [Guyanagaster necrorhizus MCA 3950]KAG7440064.1 Serine/threonine-protein kinase [Guyanagaster necrorhizus MCA 3950]